MLMTVHYEAVRHLHRTVQEIHAAGMKAGVALNPSTPVSVLEDIINDVDLVLLMSVNPGFGGQKFIPSVLRKASELVKLREERNLDFEIEIDGGASLDNLKQITDAGVSIVVAGSSVFKSDDIEKRTAEFTDMLHNI